MALLCLVGRPLDSRSPAAATFAIRHVRVFDGERLLLDRTVVVREGVIESIGNGNAQENLTTIDGSGGTLLPGLIDAHTHTDDPEQLRQALVFGVTTCLDMATPSSRLPRLREAAASKSDVADFRSAGTLATAPRGHGTDLSKYGNIPTLTDPGAAESFVAARKAEGSDYLKIMLSGVRAVRRGMPTLAPPTVKALIDAGHARGMLVVAHIESTEDARTVVERGIDGLAHIWRDRGAARDVAALSGLTRVHALYI